MIGNYRLIYEIPAGNKLGEGVQCRAATQTLWWTDIHACKLRTYNWQTKTLDTIPVPEPVGVFAFTTTKDILFEASLEKVGC